MRDTWAEFVRGLSQVDCIRFRSELHARLDMLAGVAKNATTVDLDDGEKIELAKQIYAGSVRLNHHESGDYWETIPPINALNLAESFINVVRGLNGKKD